MTFNFCEYSAVIGYATCYYENYPDSDLGEALDVALDEFILPADRCVEMVTMNDLINQLDAMTKEYQLNRSSEDVSEDEKDEDEDDEDEDDEDEDEE